MTESSRATQPVLDLHQPFLRVHFHQRHPQQSGNTRHQQNSPCRGRGQKMFVPSWENPDSEDTQQWFGQALTLQSAHFQQWEHRAWSTFRKEMTPVLTGVQTAQHMNQGCAHIKRHLHTHELSICARIAALLALKTKDKAICPGMSQQTAAGLRPTALTRGVHTEPQHPAGAPDKCCHSQQVPVLRTGSSR